MKTLGFLVQFLPTSGVLGAMLERCQLANLRKFASGATDSYLFGMTKEKNDRLMELARKISEERDADIIFYNGGIYRPFDEHLIRECISRGKEGRRDNVILMMLTPGGDPDAAYRIARCCQRYYSSFSLYVPGPCKSAGTLVAIGANELIISDHGELGPLDIQMAKQDEFFGSQSGLTVTTALEALESRAFQAVERMFMEIEQNTQGMLSVQTATDLASKTVVGLFSPIAGQVDPLHIGEASRAVLIADAYGMRLAEQSCNLREQAALQRLITQYPSHGFVIDREEAATLFTNIREPSEFELELAEVLGPAGRRVNDRTKPTVTFLTENVASDGQVPQAANEATGGCENEVEDSSSSHTAA